MIVVIVVRMNRKDGKDSSDLDKTKHDQGMEKMKSEVPATQNGNTHGVSHSNERINPETEGVIKQGQVLSLIHI